MLEPVVEIAVKLNGELISAVFWLVGLYREHGDSPSVHCEEQAVARPGHSGVLFDVS